MDSLVLRTDEPGAVTLTLNRPEKLNALSKEVLESLERQLDAVARETRKVGLVILRGAGGNFSSGYDMEEVLDFVRARAKPHFHSEVIEKLANLPQPVICAIQGHCSTGALERWGLTPIWGLSLRLPHRVGTAKASEMMLTCRTYTGREAEEMHLANLCFADDHFEAELAKLSADILANSWYANQVNKRALVASDKLPLREAHGLEIFKNEGLAPDAQQRVTQFINRKKT
jgi:enoyl-CoA hydratase/carnithine racemase